MRDRHDLVRGWMDKAASDLTAAKLLLDSPGPYDTACFHAQQAIEKILKGDI
jgi:HEPN domain-containing protein